MGTEIIVVDCDTQTVSARELHKQLDVTDRFSRWFERMLAYGFVENQDFTGVKSSTLVNNGAEIDLQDYQLSVDMAKHICMLQRTQEGMRFRRYFIELEKAWNSPEKVMARALQIADDVGFIPAGEDCLTSAAGIFAAGDCRSKEVRQLTTACADGAVAGGCRCRYPAAAGSDGGLHGQSDAPAFLPGGSGRRKY